MEIFKKEIQSIMDAFAGSLKKLEDQCKFADRNYTGDMLVNKRNEINTKILNLKRNTQELIDQAAQDAKYRIQSAEIKGKDLNSADFALLDPQRVKLKQSEFDELSQRYAGNRAMCIALRTYAESCNLEFTDYTNVETTCKQVDDLAKSANGWIYSGNGYFDVNRLAMMGTARMI